MNNKTTEAPSRDASAADFPSLPMEAVRLVPHRPPMLLIHELLEKEGSTAAASAVVPADEFFLEEDGDHRRLMPEFLVEIMAQGLAAADGMDALERSRPVRDGFLVGIEDFIFYRQPEPGARLRIELEKENEFASIVYFSGRILDESGRLLASGVLKIWVEETSG